MYYTTLLKWLGKEKQVITISILIQKKAFDKIQHPFMIKNKQKNRNKGNFFKVVKGIYENTQS